MKLYDMLAWNVHRYGGDHQIRVVVACPLVSSQQQLVANRVAEWWFKKHDTLLAINCHQLLVGWPYRSADHYLT